MDLICHIWRNQYHHLQSYKQHEKRDRRRKIDALYMGWAISLCRCQGQLEGQGQGNCTLVIMITSPRWPRRPSVMRKRKRISSAGRRCTVGRKRGSGETMRWKNEQEEGEETADKLREINMKWWKETRTGKDSQHEMRREEHWEVFIWIDAPEARTLEWIPNSCHGGICSTSTLLERNKNSQGSHREFLVELISEERVGQFPEVQLAEWPHAVDVLEVNFPCQIWALVRNKLLSETIWKHNNMGE